MDDDLPQIHDEASPTPAWIPIIGVLILVAMALAALVRGALPDRPAIAAAAPSAEAPRPTPAAGHDRTPVPDDE